VHFKTRKGKAVAISKREVKERANVNPQEVLRAAKTGGRGGPIVTDLKKVFFGVWGKDSQAWKESVVRPNVRKSEKRGWAVKIKGWEKGLS